MSVYLEAAEEVERAAARATAMIAVAADLKRVGSLQNAANEAQARLDALTAGEAQAVVDRKTKHDAAERELVGILVERDDALNARDKAKADGALIIADAGARAADIIAHANSDAAAIKSTAESAAAILHTDTQDALADVRQDIADAQASLLDLTTQIAGRQAVLDDLNAQVAAIKARF